MEGRAWATRCDARTCDGLRPPRARVGARWSELTEQRKKKSRTVFFFPRPLPTGGLGGSAMALRGSSFPRSPPQGARYTLNTSAPPSLPTNPSASPSGECREVLQNRVISGGLGLPRRAISGDLARSRSRQAPPTPAQKKEGSGWSRGAHVSLGAPDPTFLLGGSEPARPERESWLSGS